MALSLKPSHLKRYKDILSLIVRYGDATQFDPDTVDAQAAEAGDPRAEALVDELEGLGPTFIKLGQMLSTRPDLLPPAYLEALRRLQDKVTPLPFADIKEVVEAELGTRISKAFAAFEETPLAAASLAQVHRATLHDGRMVAVKVQRPGIRQKLETDLEALDQVASVLDAHTEAGQKYRIQDVVSEFRRAVLHELDYRDEAENLRRISEALARHEDLLVPLPVGDYTRQRVLTMDLVRGRNISGLGPLAQLEMDGARLAETLFQAYLDQILVEGFFHADPHPGNLFLTEDRRLALLDLGQVAQVSPRMQESLLRLLVALGEGRGEEAAEVGFRLSDTSGPHDADAYLSEVASLVARNAAKRPETVVVGREIMEVVRIGAEHGVFMPRELVMLGKTLLALDEVARLLDPGFDPTAAIRRNVAEVTQRRLRKNVSPGQMLGSALEAAELAGRLPGTLNRILDDLARRGPEVSVRSLDVNRILAGMQNIANRITVGLVIAALILGAAMLVRVKTEFTLFGYPGLAILFFLAAATAGAWVVFDIVRRDI